MLHWAPACLRYRTACNLLLAAFIGRLLAEQGRNVTVCFRKGTALTACPFSAGRTMLQSGTSGALTSS